MTSIRLIDMIGPYCCLCFETPPEGVSHMDWLEPVEGEPGRVWNVCRGCAELERVAVVENDQ